MNAIILNGLAYRLPETARLKLESLRGESDAANAGCRQLSETLRELRVQKREAEADADRMATGKGFQRSYPKDHPTLVATRQKANRASAEICRITAAVEDLSEHWKCLAGLVKNLENWISNLGDAGIESCGAPVAPDLHKGESIIDAIERCRRRVRELAANLQSVHAAPITSARAKQLMRNQVADIAARGTPDIFPLIEHGEQIAWPKLDQKFSVSTTGGHAGFARGEIFDPIAMQIWLHRDAVVTALDREIEKCADDKSALDDAARAGRVKELLADMFAMERDEESLIETAAARDFKIDRRQDADPRAVLGLANSLPPPNR